MNETIFSHINTEYEIVLVSRDSTVISAAVSDLKDRLRPLAVVTGRIVERAPSGSGYFVRISDKETAFLPKNRIRDDAFLFRKKEGAVSGGDRLILQISADSMHEKRKEVTADIELAGRYMVLTADGSGRISVSKKIGKRNSLLLKERWEDKKLPGFRLLLRTEAEGFLTDDTVFQNMREEYDLILKRISDIKKKAAAGSLYQILEDAPSLTEQAGFHYPDARVEELPFSLLYETLEHIKKRTADFGSGGRITIDHTRAMTCIDVDSGSLRRKAYDINLASIPVIAREIMLRDISGIIMIDFLKMTREEQELIRKEMERAVRTDENEVSVYPFTSLGIMEMARGKRRRPLREYGPEILFR